MRSMSSFRFLLYAGGLSGPGGENGEGLLLVLTGSGLSSAIGATLETTVLGTIPLNMSVQFAQVALCVPVLFTWLMGGVETFLVFIVAGTSTSEFIQGGAVEEALLRGGE